jgi:hypothetical protein
VAGRQLATDNLGDAISIRDYTLTYYLRTNTASEGATVVGTADGSGWEFTIAAATARLDLTLASGSGRQLQQEGSESVTLGTGQIQVLAALDYTGTPGAFDGRTQIGERS